VPIQNNYEKNMSLGMRRPGHNKLTDEEIEIVKKAILQIEADINVFRFNDERHKRTCYVADEDIVYIGGDIFPDLQYASNHPRDLMSIRAVLAHEYYGHRPHRDEYLKDLETGDYTIPRYEDEYRADYEAAKYGKGLDDFDRYHLMQSAILRKEEVGQIVETDDFMKEVLYGYSSSERRFINRGKRIGL
jgi:hypothetical protein